MEGLGFNLTLHPFVLTLKAYAVGNCDTFEDSPLARYYRHFQPKSAADALGLGSDSALGHFPAVAMVLPWEPLLPHDAAKRRQQIIKAETRERGAGRTALDFWNVIGPASQEQGASELTRLIQLFENIRNRGYRRHDRRDGDVTGVILLDGEEWAVTIRGGGQHRIAVLAGLAFASAPIRIKPDQQNSLIRRNEADKWPNVRSGMFTRDEALSVFDRILKGRPPPDRDSTTMAKSTLSRAPVSWTSQLSRQSETAAAHCRRLITWSLDCFGVRPTWSTPIDLRGKADDPIAATHLANGQSFVIEVPLERCRGMGAIGFDLGPRTLNPFVLTLKAYASGTCVTFDDSPLARYYGHFQPKSAAEALGVDKQSALRGFSAVGLLLPWETAAPRAWQGRSPNISRANRRHATDTDDPVGWPVFGPVSQETGTLEMRRLTRLSESALKQGCHRSGHQNHEITGVVLLDGEDWALSIRGGDPHGVALAALGYPSAQITIRSRGVNSFIRRSEVDHWPQVRNGLFTRVEALDVFDRILAGRPPRGAIPQEWLSATSQHQWKATAP